MELKDYISETISNVILGIKDAQKKIEKSGGYINPVIQRYGNNESKHLARGARTIEEVEFEIVLKLEEAQGSGAKINVFSGLFGGSIKAQSQESNQSMNKIKFSVPIAYPQQDDDTN